MESDEAQFEVSMLSTWKSNEENQPSMNQR
jgi:hypothetical protein